MRYVSLVLALVLAFALAAGPALVGAAAASQEARHSGRVVAVDLRAGVLTLEEAGAAAGPEPVRLTRRFVIESGTSWELVQRSAEPVPGDWPGGYRATPISPETVKPGDFATVAVERREGKLVARRVSIVRPAE